MEVLKFGALWCPGCLIMKPRWQKIEAENPWLKSIYYDFDEDKEAVGKYQIGNVLPVFIFLDKDEKEFLRLTGEVSRKKLIQILEENKDR